MALAGRRGAPKPPGLVPGPQKPLTGAPRGEDEPGATGARAAHPARQRAQQLELGQAGQAAAGQSRPGLGPALEPEQLAQLGAAHQAEAGDELQGSQVAV